MVIASKTDKFLFSQDNFLDEEAWPCTIAISKKDKEKYGSIDECKLYIDVLDIMSHIYSNEYEDKTITTMTKELNKRVAIHAIESEHMMLVDCEIIGIALDCMDPQKYGYEKDSKENATWLMMVVKLVQINAQYIEEEEK